MGPNSDALGFIRLVDEICGMLWRRFEMLRLVPVLTRRGRPSPVPRLLFEAAFMRQRGYKLHEIGAALRVFKEKADAGPADISLAVQGAGRADPATKDELRLEARRSLLRWRRFSARLPQPSGASHRGRDGRLWHIQLLSPRPTEGEIQRNRLSDAIRHAVADWMEREIPAHHLEELGPVTVGLSEREIPLLDALRRPHTYAEARFVEPDPSQEGNVGGGQQA